MRAMPSKQSISYLAITHQLINPKLSAAAVFAVALYLFAGISIFSCARSCLPLTIGRSEFEVLQTISLCSCTGGGSRRSRLHQVPDLYKVRSCFHIKLRSSKPYQTQSKARRTAPSCILCNLTLVIFQARAACTPLTFAQGLRREPLCQQRW